MHLHHKLGDLQAMSQTSESRQVQGGQAVLTQNQAVTPSQAQEEQAMLITNQASGLNQVQRGLTAPVPTLAVVAITAQPQSAGQPMLETEAMAVDSAPVPGGLHKANQWMVQPPQQPRAMKRGKVSKVVPDEQILKAIFPKGVPRRAPGGSMSYVKPVELAVPGPVDLGLGPMNDPTPENIDSSKLRQASPPADAEDFGSDKAELEGENETVLECRMHEQKNKDIQDKREKRRKQLEADLMECEESRPGRIPDGLGV
ncbi:hypothetical protein DXG01_015502 [Tephrocybe rancida]|nr:hypothetical protein DXG01_015502 [Tephrocybe rancida]